MAHIHFLARRLAWPGFLLLGLSGSALAFQSASPIINFVLVYLGTFALIALAERLLPFEQSWLESDGETLNDIGHTLLTKGVVEVLSGLGVVFPMLAAKVFAASQFLRIGGWPVHVPLPLQVVLALIIAEFGLYWAHRLAHEHLNLWRFHALHHSVERLWVVNTGRFHVVDSVFKITLSQVPLYLLGAPVEVFLWVGAVTAFIGILTHCNLDVVTGPLDYVFSTPRLHRWHHSLNLREGNSNYGENLVLFDQLFGTYFNPDRQPGTHIGITGRIAKGFFAQLAQPFSQKGRKQILGAKPKAYYEAQIAAELEKERLEHFQEKRRPVFRLKMPRTK
ncbi:sterol desaturase family protein [Allorhizobium undicola]|uniref:sterol desaturase family protein n=1 Tax=Allorhizobium undicola TaxID=78527 RepID=UPI000A066958|nr:sterol desaturase family protein [Allorhizobium undicola]